MPTPFFVPNDFFFCSKSSETSKKLILEGGPNLKGGREEGREAGGACMSLRASDPNIFFEENFCKNDMYSQSDLHELRNCLAAKLLAAKLLAAKLSSGETVVRRNCPRRNCSRQNCPRRNCPRRNCLRRNCLAAKMSCGETVRGKTARGETVRGETVRGETS